MRNEPGERQDKETGLKVVLDTNVYISAFHFSEGVCARLLEDAAEQYYELIISPVIIQEFAGASRRNFQVNEEKHLQFIKFLARTGKIVAPQTIPDVIKEDSPDNHILACALAGNANLIVSQDLDLLRRKTFETIGIMSPIDFLNTLERFKKAA